MSRMTLREIADRISAHLTRMELDPASNPRRGVGGMSLTKFYHTNAYAYGGGVGVTYIGFQGVTRLKKEEAERYLAWLDAGGVGTHREIPAQRVAAGG